MKQNLKIAAFVTAFIALAITGCQKELSSLNTTPATDIQALTAQTESENNAVEVLYNDASGEMTATNEGIAFDYLVTAEDFDATANSMGANSSSTSNLVNHSFMRCLKDLKLDTAQVRKIRMALRDYNDCKTSAIHRARAIHAKLVAKYKDLAAEQAKLLKDGKITKAEYQARIERLRHAFEKELRELQLKDKVNEALKDCHAKFLRHLNGILTDRQWKAFVDCYKK